MLQKDYFIAHVVCALRPRWNRTRFDIMSVPFFTETRQKVRRRENSVPFCIDGKKRKRIENLNLLATGLKNIVGTWTI